MVLGDTGPRTANTWVSTWTGEQLVETTQALDKPRHGARGASLTHSQTATPESEYASRLGKHAQMGDLDEKEAQRADPQRVEKSGPTAGGEHSQLQARNENPGGGLGQDKVQNDIAMEVGRNPRLVMRC